MSPVPVNSVMKNIVRGNFDASVAAYGQYERLTGRFSTLSRLLAVELTVTADRDFGTVLDAGAGSGVSTRVLREYATRVVAFDISREMLADNTASERVQGDIDTVPFRADVFDGVAFTASLFLVPDPRVAVEEAHRVLRSDGVVGAVAPVGWFGADGANVFDSLTRDSRSPAATEDVIAAVENDFETRTGTWRFPTTAAHIQRFHEIPAMAARLYPRDDPDERVRKARALLDSLEGTFEQQWRWVVGTLA